jgi:hypothetical protein
VDFIPVFAFHILRANEARLEEPGDKSSRPDEGVQDMDIFIGDGAVEFLLQDILDGVEHEIDAFHRSIDDAQFFNCQRESTLEELFIEVLDDGLLAGQVIDFAYVTLTLS